MGREIKFRVWDKKDEKMIDWVSASRNEIWKLNDPAYQTRNVPMQYTGLTDSEGMEIYEGDIIDFTYWWFDGNEAESHLIGEVVYLPGCLSYGLKGVKNKDWIRHIGGSEGDSDTAPFATWLFEEADFEILGNVYENPELLEEESHGTA